MKKLNNPFFPILFYCLLIGSTLSELSAQIAVGNGSYTTSFPGTDAAGRNGYPSGSPQLSGNALGKPVPTNDWWSKLIQENHADNLFNYPYAMKTLNEGLIASYIPWGVYGDHQPFVIGLEGLNANKVTISDYSDWIVTMNWDDGTHQLQATSGIGMPFLYFTKKDNDKVKITVNTGTVTISDEMLLIVDAASGADFAIYAPLGSSWNKSGKTYTSTLNGKNYWSMAMLPQDNANAQSVATEYKKYAYVFPKNTTATWTYNESSSVMRTDFVVETDVKEGSEEKMLLGLLPHQWANLASDSHKPEKYSYSSVRGEIKTLDGNEFSVENTFHGILPTLPYVCYYSDGFNIAEMSEKISLIENDGLATWTDSYNEGQVMNRLIQTARIADLMGNASSRDKMLATIKERLEDWLTYESGEKAFLFYYNSTWSAMLGYPAGHGQDNNINDHHFHWGYFIHAAAFLEQYEPGWAAQWGEMVNKLVHDASTPNRSHEQFPYLRNFSPYAGHCWANGFASFPQGNDQESTSESMQFHSSLIHWGTVTGNDEIRDLGIYLYTTEQTAIEEYWFDMYERNFKNDHPYSLVSRVWGNSYDNGTFWTADIAASYNIELYPIHGGSLYLGHNTDYVQKLWTEMTKNTGILKNEENPNLWHDVMWEYLAFIDPAEAIEMYDSYPERTLKFGVSDAQTYYWLHCMNALGKVDATLTADYPIAVAFNKDGELTYTAHNYGDADITVTFSDGYKLSVPANKMVTSKDVKLDATLSASFASAYLNGSVDLTVLVSEGTAAKIEFFDGNVFIGESTIAPFEIKAENLEAGIHNFYARVYEDTNFGVTNISTVTVGKQLPYSGTPIAIPGEFEAGTFDKFEGGLGQGISYNDVSPSNEGDLRVDEFVDVLKVNSEGATIGWISSGEWVEYTVNVEKSGMHSLTFRYACGNAGGGGPFKLELDGKIVSENIAVSSTHATNGWSTWKSKTISNIALPKGEHVLRIAFDNGELNLGKLKFAYSGELSYNQPVANAGNNVIVVLPETTATLDASGSESPGAIELAYQWTQVNGPSVIIFDDAAATQPKLSNLEKGIYTISLEVSNGSYSDVDEMLLIVSNEANIAPMVSIVSPERNSQYMANTEVAIIAAASDLDGSIQKVEFFEGETLIGTSTSAPYSIVWSDVEGQYSITAVATDNDDKATTSQAISIDMTKAFTVEGTWKLAPQAQAMGVGPGQGDMGWWSNSESDVTTRGCLFDDKYVFAADGTFKNEMGSATWREAWQGVAEGCGSPIVPHDGSNVATWAFDGENLKLSGLGAHICLPKVINGAEISNPANAASSITYIVSEINSTNMTLDIEIAGGGFWRFILEKVETTGLDVHKEQDIRIYPNPASDKLSIESDICVNMLKIHNLLGQSVKCLSMEARQEQIDISELKAGHYILILELSNGKNYIEQIIVK